MAISLARGFSDGVLHTSWSLLAGAPDDARKLKMRVSSLQQAAQALSDPRVLAPLLPMIFSTWKLDGDVALASSSGWAHGVSHKNPTVVYCHTPPRWLHVDTSCGSRRGLDRKVVIASSRALLNGWDRRAAGRALGYIANSANIRNRIWDVYGVDSPVVHPPLTPLKPPTKPHGAPAAPFVLLVARARGYKNISLAAEALSLSRSGVTLVVVGQGTETLTDGAAGVLGLGRVSDEELAWLYREAEALMAVGQEDFGLTPVEATSVGTPTVAIPAGGYLETVVPGKNGVLAASQSAADLSRALQECLEQQWDCESMTKHAATFSEGRFHREVRTAIEELAA